MSAICLLVGCGSGLARAGQDDDDAMHDCATKIGAQLDARVAEVLPRIDGTGRQLLALRSYLRSGRTLGERWSWTREQIAAYEGSPEQVDLRQAIERVRTSFVKSNPGLDLWVNPQVRSLDVQIENWNGNESVAAAAKALVEAMRARIGSTPVPRQDSDRVCVTLQSFLAAYAPEAAPTLAAPGLSPHGQMRAIDFQVVQGERVVAGPDASTIATDWEAAGWAARLDAAVRSASRRFVGPLASPNEPWHYTFTPELAVAQ